MAGRMKMGASRRVMRHADEGDLNIRFNFNPKESQLPYLLSSAMYKLGGGRRGGGKSHVLANAGTSLSLDFPGNRGFIGRRDFSDFRTTTMLELEKAIPRDLLRYHNQQNKEYRIATARSLETGDDKWDSFILYGELKDANSILSGEIGWFGIDEAFEVPQLSFSHLSASLRHRLPDGSYPPYFGMLMSNPSPGWLMDYFPVLPQEQAIYQLLCERYGEFWQPQTAPTVAQYPNKVIDFDYAYFPFGAADIEEILPPGYLRNITRVYEREGPAMVARMVFGDWGFQIEGLVYQLQRIHRWNPTKVGQRLYQEDKPVLIGIDPSNGAGCYAATVWQTLGKKKLVVAEYKKKGATDDDFIDWLSVQPFANSVIGAVCDSARPDTIKRLQAKGLPVRGVGQKDIVAQISAVKELMRLDENGEAMLLIDEAQCPQLVREFGLYSYKTQRPGGPNVPETPVHAWNDLLDSCAYLVRAYWPVARMSESFEYGEAVAHSPLYLSRSAIRKRK